MTSDLSWRTIAGLTLGMGVAVTVSWFAFFRSLESYGLDPGDMIRPARLAVYATQFLLIGGFVYALTRRWLRGMSVQALALSVGAAWLLEGVILTVIGEPIVANELDPVIAWYYWLAATAGPLQPAVAFLAGWLGLRHAHASREGGRC